MKKRSYIKNILIIVDSENKIVERKEYKYFNSLVNHVLKNYGSKGISYIVENNEVIYKVTL